MGARRELGLLVSVFLASVVVVGTGATFATRSIAQQQALEDGERRTQQVADLVVGPLLPAFLSGASRRVDGLDARIEDRLRGSTLAEVTVWAPDGTILYAHDAAAIGRRVTPPPEVPRAAAGAVSSGFESGEPEARAADRTSGRTQPSTRPARRRPQRYVEVYVPLALPDRTVVFEAYYDYAPVDRVADRLLAQTLPLVLGSLVLLQLIQVPAVVSLVRRLERHEAERTGLLEQALSATDRERARFAGDLHDGPIQELAGIGYAFGAFGPTTNEADEALMGRMAEALQRAIRSLRGLMTELYPVELDGGGLELAVRSLGEPLAAAGVDVRLDLDVAEHLAPEVLLTLYRVVRESLANVAKHARATTVLVSLTLVGGSPAGALRLVVLDDGVGAQVADLDRRADGHLGLWLMKDRVRSLGGELSVVSVPGQGTRVEVVMPLAPPVRGR